MQIKWKLTERLLSTITGKWNDEEKKTLDERVKIAADAVKAFAFIGLARCMNEFNTK